MKKTSTLLGVLFAMSWACQSILAQSAEINPRTLTLQVGETKTVTATVKDAQGAPLPLPAVQWLPLPGLTSCVTVTNGAVTATRTGQCGVSFLVYLDSKLIYPTEPVLVTVTAGPRVMELNGRSLAIDSLFFTVEPFPISNPLYFGADKRTRILVFAENISAQSTMSAELADGAKVVPVVVESLNAVASTPVVAIRLLLPDDATLQGKDVQLTLTVNSVRSNGVKVRIQ